MDTDAADVRAAVDALPFHNKVERAVEAFDMTNSMLPQVGEGPFGVLAEAARRYLALLAGLPAAIRDAVARGRVCGDDGAEAERQAQQIIDNLTGENE
ncbi:MAG TPA: hypothetical protein VEA69_21110 [Tepidisphaeraceae bacterium]|nr:hypothetical protein [Tepidisphaeraceae bacterium]